MSRAALLALGVACVVGAAGCKSERTEVVVRVWGSPAVVEQARGLDIVLRAGTGPDATAYAETGREHFDLGTDRTALPIDVAIVPADADASRHFELVASVTDSSGTTLTQARAISGFVEGRTKQLDLWLSEGCLGVTCAAGQTCFEDGACVDAHVDSAALPDFATRPMSPPFDAGADAGLYDAGPPLEREGGSPVPTCASAAACDDGNPCTDDACDAERCAHRPNAATCDDGVACSHDDTCHDGECRGVPGCTVGLCSRLTGECECAPGAPGCGG